MPSADHGRAHVVADGRRDGATVQRDPRVARPGVGIIYISHRLDEMAQIVDRVTVLRDGRYIGTERFADTSIDEIVSRWSGARCRTSSRRAPRCLRGQRAVRDGTLARHAARPGRASSFGAARSWASRD
jgi:ABC-type sugar transport system ATPase subunit